MGKARLAGQTPHSGRNPLKDRMKRRSKKAGLPPGSLVLIGDEPDENFRITALDYDGDSCTEKRNPDLETCLVMKGTDAVTWIHVEGLRVDIVKRLSEAFDLHPLVQEDILNTDQRPKVEDYGEYIYLVLKMFGPGGNGPETLAEQVSIVLGPRYVLSFCERQTTAFDPLRERIKAGSGRIRKLGPDYLAYSLMDAVVDGYFGVLESTGEVVDTLEEKLVTTPGPEILRSVYKEKRNLIFLRRSVWPLREVVSALARSESPLVQEGTKIYLRDVYDHTIQVIDIIETFRDMTSGMLDMYLSSVSNRMNEIMKVLTIMSTLFIPLTFIVGLYGMNFEFMPELKWRFGYPFALGIMIFTVGGMLLFFRRKRWI